MLVDHGQDWLAGRGVRSQPLSWEYYYCRVDTSDSLSLPSSVVKRESPKISNNSHVALLIVYRHSNPPPSDHNATTRQNRNTSVPRPVALIRYPSRRTESQISLSSLAKIYTQHLCCLNHTSPDETRSMQHARTTGRHCRLSLPCASLHNPTPPPLSPSRRMNSTAEA
jgi:hypothetical protein